MSGSALQSETPAEAQPGRRSLLHPAADPWLTGWFAVLAWVAISVSLNRGLALVGPGWLVWSAAFVGGLHFAMSYRLAYDDPRRSCRQHPMALLVAPLVLGVVLLGLVWLGASGAIAGAEGIRSLFSVVFALTMWHYVKQTYGVVTIGAMHTRFEMSSGEKTAVRYGLYPLWVVSLLGFVDGRAFVDIADFELRVDLLDGATGGARLALVAASAVVLSSALVRAAHRAGRRAPGAVVAPLLAAVLWVGLMPSVLIAAVLLPAFHALQYSVVAYRAQASLLGYPQRANRSERWQVGQIMVAAGCAGTLAAGFVPDLLDRFAPAGSLGLWPAAVFVFLNLHHYILDATIWRSDGRLIPAVLRSN